MKKITCVILVLLLLLGACSAPAAIVSASAASADTDAPSPSPSPSPSPTASDDSDDSDAVIADPSWVNSELASYYKDDIAAADDCHVKIGDTEYYFDTDKLVQMDYGVEFPLYRDTPQSDPEYLGTTGYCFQVNGQYVYVQSDMDQTDFPENAMTRIVNLNTLSVVPFGRGVDIFIPKEGGNVYYTHEVGSSIYSADASLKASKEIHVDVPDKSEIEKTIQQSIKDLYVSISITGAANGWIDFSYSVFDIQGPIYYKGNYRISTKGKNTEKTDKGWYAVDTTDVNSDTTASPSPSASGDGNGN